MSQTKNNPNPKKMTDGVLPKIDLPKTEQPKAEAVKAEVVKAAPAAPADAPVAGSTAQPLKLSLAKPEKKRQRVIAVANVPTDLTVDGVRYTFTLPINATVTTASHDVGWLGREGSPLRAHICLCDAGAVILMPQTDGTWKANTFSAGKITVAK